MRRASCQARPPPLHQSHIRKPFLCDSTLHVRVAIYHLRRNIDRKLSPKLNLAAPGYSYINASTTKQATKIAGTATEITAAAETGAGRRHEKFVGLGIE